MSEKNVRLQNAADRMRIHSIRATNASNSGHPTSCASMAEIMSVLFLDVMRYHVHDPRNPNNDRFVLSKGHAAPVLYAAWVEAGLLQPDDVLNLRKIHSDLEGHPTPRLSFVDVATGSLGQGLSCAAGMAYTGKYIEKGSYRVFCVLGDGETAEGSVWEALSFSGIYKLDNLVAIFDINRLGQSQPTAFQHDIELYEKRVASFGWNTIVVDGHDIAALLCAFERAANTKDKPTAILAKSFKGAGLGDKIHNEENWHGKPLGDCAAGIIAMLEAKIKSSSVDGAGDRVLKPQAPCDVLQPVDSTIPIKMLDKPGYKIGQMVATRLAYGNALVKLGAACNRVIALDADTKNSTFSIKFLEKFPDRFVECFIAEQNMIGVGIGCATRSRTIPFVNTFAAFLTRGFDQLRMGAVSQTDCNFAGSHVGVSIGEDGPSQMALEDLALFRSLPGSTVFYPSDAVATEHAVVLAANTKGICFIRTGRPNTAVIYSNDETFEIGKAKVLRTSSQDQVTVVSAGVTLYEALKAADSLAQKGVHVRVVDLFTIKPIDEALLRQCARETKGRVITVEDHYPEGGLGEAVMSALATEPGVVVKKLAVREVPRSGQPEELLSMFGIDAASICAAVVSIAH